MNSPSVTIQITPELSPAMPSWMGEVAAFAHVLIHTGVLKTIQEQVRFARTRLGKSDLIDFVVVLIGYIVNANIKRFSIISWARGCGIMKQEPPHQQFPPLKKRVSIRVCCFSP